MGCAARSHSNQEPVFTAPVKYIPLSLPSNKISVNHQNVCFKQISLIVIVREMVYVKNVWLSSYKEILGECKLVNRKSSCNHKSCMNSYIKSNKSRLVRF
jgi:hypothetical protein